MTPNNGNLEKSEHFLTDSLPYIQTGLMALIVLYGAIVFINQHIFRAVSSAKEPKIDDLSVLNAQHLQELKWMQSEKRDNIEVGQLDRY